jgi:Uma2 family endonuclease
VSIGTLDGKGSTAATIRRDGRVEAVRARCCNRNDTAHAFLLALHRGDGIIEGLNPTKEAGMSTASVTAPALMTAEQFAERPDPGFPEELVRGRIVPMAVPDRRHGQICSNALFLFRSYADAHELGHVLCNDSGVITERGLDTVRGANVSIYSFTRVPKGPLPDGYLDAPPDLVVEVLSPSERWPKALAKVAEYLEAGTIVVVVLDDIRRIAHVYRADGTTRVLAADEELTLPDLLGDFCVRVGRFFE